MAHYMSMERFSEIEASPFVVQIGAMDGVAYDPVHAYLKNRQWRGLLIEPLPDMYQQLQDTYHNCADRISLANVAIADPASIDDKGQIKMIRPDPARIADGSLPVWARGVATLADRPAHNAMGYTEVNQYAIEEVVCATTLDALLSNYNIERVDVLQIDVEGNDFRVLKQFDFDRYHPSVINMEYTNLPPEEMQATQILLAANGYMFVTHRHDLFATDASTLYRLARPEEMRPYEDYREELVDNTGLPHVVAMLGEVAGQFAGTVLLDSSVNVRDLLGSIDDNPLSNAYTRAKKPQVYLALDAITRMKPYFRSNTKLKAFLEAELPDKVLAQYRHDIDKAIAVTSEMAFLRADVKDRRAT